ncbi:hypothetical protein ACN27G_04430 [Plantactinospora sp. WMMB334]|uniref:hypothetical protein n=1 Tax=Plantactinospora sp. WMMB334 TaxID=3404119 RepID=UPI003B925F7A
MTQPVRVNVPGLRRLGAEIVDHGAELKRTVAAVDDRLVPPGGPGVDGWAALDATTRAARGWSSCLTGLGARIEAAGSLLSGSADNYEESEKRSVQRIGRVRPMPAPEATGSAGPPARSGTG